MDGSVCKCQLTAVSCQLRMITLVMVRNGCPDSFGMISAISRHRGSFGCSRHDLHATLGRRNRERRRTEGASVPFSGRLPQKSLGCSVGELPLICVSSLRARCSLRQPGEENYQQTRKVGNADRNPAEKSRAIVTHSPRGRSGVQV